MDTAFARVGVRLHVGPSAFGNALGSSIAASMAKEPTAAERRMMDADGPSRARNVAPPLHVEPMTAEQLGIGPVQIDVGRLAKGLSAAEILDMELAEYVMSPEDRAANLARGVAIAESNKRTFADSPARFFENNERNISGARFDLTKFLARDVMKRDFASSATLQFGDVLPDTSYEPAESPMGYGEQMRRVGRFYGDVAIGAAKGLNNIIPETAALAYRMTGYVIAGAVSYFDTDVSDAMFAKYEKVTGRIWEYDNAVQEFAGISTQILSPWILKGGAAGGRAFYNADVGASWSGVSGETSIAGVKNSAGYTASEIRVSYTGSELEAGFVGPLRGPGVETLNVFGGQTARGTTFSGHGAWSPVDGTVLIPEGTSLTVYAEHGASISNRLGNVIETGGDVSKVYSRTFMPGELAPNYVLHPPGELTLLGGSTVRAATPLETLLQPNMGPVNWAACVSNYRSPNANFVYGVDGVYDSIGLKDSIFWKQVKKY